MQEFMNIAKSLSDQNRVRIIMALLEIRELCVCQIIEFLGLAPSTVSKHMFILKNAGLVECKKSGVWIYYRINSSPSSVIRGALNWLKTSLSGDAKIAEDISKLRKIKIKNSEKSCIRKSNRRKR